MSLRVLIVPDKFKGTLTARHAAEAMARGWRKSRPQDELELLPITDGGDGFGEIISGLFRAKVQLVMTVDAAHRPCRARWWWEPRGKTAVIESASVIGLAGLPPKKFHPFELDTFGLGAVIRAAAKKGAARCLIGIGGSATNDAGFGLARALGWNFVDRRGKEIARWTQLDLLATVQPPRRTRWFAKLIVAVDVQNPLLGARGCSRVYGPQKGLTPEDFSHAEACLRRLAAVVKRQMHRDHSRQPGAGAAGGLGFGLASFLGAELRPGFELFARKAKLDQRLRRADLVITGEGAMDASSFMGKGAGEIAHLCLKLKIPCIGLAGIITSPRKKLFSTQRSLTELTSLEKARQRPAYWLERLAAQVANDWPPSAD
jgi:glycerate kinase